MLGRYCNEGKASSWTKAESVNWWPQAPFPLQCFTGSPTCCSRLSISDPKLCEPWQWKQPRDPSEGVELRHHHPSEREDPRRCLQEHALFSAAASCWHGPRYSTNTHIHAQSKDTQMRLAGVKSNTLTNPCISERTLRHVYRLSVH